MSGTIYTKHRELTALIVIVLGTLFLELSNFLLQNDQKCDFFHLHRRNYIFHLRVTFPNSFCPKGLSMDGTPYTDLPSIHTEVYTGPMTCKNASPGRVQASQDQRGQSFGAGPAIMTSGKHLRSGLLFPFL